MARSPVTKTIMMLEEFRTLDETMPIQMAHILMLIADKPGISLSHLTKLTGLGKSSVARHVAALSKQFGKGLVDYSEDPMDRRNKVATLTPQGERFVRKIAHLVEG